MTRGLLALVLAAACGDSSPGQHEITAEGELLTDDGRLREPGWSRRQLLHWDPSRVHDPDGSRQWDFFAISNGSAAVNLTLVDLGFIQLGSVGVVDFATGEAIQGGALKGGSGVLALSPAVEGTASLTPAGAPAPVMTFVTTSDTTEVSFDLPPSSLLGEAAQGSFTIHRRPSMPYLFNLGDGFGDDQAGTENLVVYDDVAHKLGRVTWSHDPADPMVDWSFEADDGRLSLMLHPIAPEISDLDLGAKFSHLRKAYGTYSGTIVLDDGTELVVVDVPGFAERMDQSW
jgi:hypothetical protein